MAVLSRSETEFEIATDIIKGDRIVMRRLPEGALEISILNPAGGFDGGPIVAGTVLSPREVETLEELLAPR